MPKISMLDESDIKSEAYTELKDEPTNTLLHELIKNLGKGSGPDFDPNELKGIKQTINYMLDRKEAKVNAQDTQGRTPLHYACQLGELELIELLLLYKADPNIADGKKITPMMAAYITYRQENVDQIFALLIKHGADCSAYPWLSERLLASQLFEKIKEMKVYGENLQKEGSNEKGQAAIDLADKLNGKVKDFFQENKKTIDSFQNFSTSFLELLNSKNSEMSHYRRAWGTITKNIAIALTVVGMFLIVAKLIHSKASHGRALFFFQKKKTEGESKVEAIKEAFASFSQPSLG